MKRNFILCRFARKSLALVSCFIIIVSISCYALAGTIDTTDSPVLDTAFSCVADMSTSGASADALYFTKDLEGNSLGPADYVVEDHNTYMLNTATNTIYKYQSNQLIEEIPLDDSDVFGIRLCANDGDIYVLSNCLTVEKVTEEGVTNIGNVNSILTMDSVFNFEAIGRYIYMSEPTSNGNVTYVLEKNLETGSLEKVNTIAGYMVDENTFYQSELVSDEGRIFGHRCNISVMDKNGNETDFIELSSDNYIVGAQYLGKNTTGDYIVKQIEMSIADGSMEETIRTINSEDEVVNCSHVAEVLDSMVTQIKVIDGEVYQFEMNHDTGTISSIATECLPQAENFISTLSRDIVSSKEYLTVEIEAAEKTAAASSVTRTSVIQKAQEFWCDYWTCTDENLASLADWRCPRYVTGADTYTSTPYCWGGFHSVSQFYNGLKNGGRVGNINCDKEKGYISGTYGLDCSGYVSRCWGQTTKYGTSTLYQISTSLPDHSYLQPGDALNKVNNHVMLFYDTDGSGNYRLFESTLYNQYDRVTFTLRTITSVNNYTAIRYDGITDS